MMCPEIIALQLKKLEEHHRIVQVESDSCRSLLKAELVSELVSTSKLGQITQDHIQLVLNISKDEGSTTSLYSLGFCTVLLNQNFCCCSLCLLPLVLSLWISEHDSMFSNT